MSFRSCGVTLRPRRAKPPLESEQLGVARRGVERERCQIFEAMDYM